MGQTYRWKTRPYKHQVRAVRFALAQFKAGRGVAFLMEPRTGKTKAAIDTLCILNRLYGLRKAVVIAPNRVLDTWVEEFHRHSTLMVDLIVWDKDERRNALPKHMGAYAMQVIVVNYEAFSTPGRRTPSGRRSRATGRFKHRQRIMQWLGDDANAACVVDEGHKLKAPEGKSSTMIVSMRDLFAFRFLLTGTPVTKAKRAHDIFMQWQWVNPRRFSDWGRTVEDFKNHTGRWISKNGYPQWVAPRPDGLEDLRDGIHRDGLVVRRDECLDLPPRMPDRVIRVPLGPSAKHYDEMAQEMVTELESGHIAEASIPLVVTLRLQQITSGFVGIRERRTVNGKPKMVTVAHRIGFEKLNRLEAILGEETMDHEEKIVIAAKFVSDLNAIEQLCTTMGLPWWSIRGGVARADTTTAIREFREHDEAGAMIVQPAAASLGIDLSTAAHMVWYSLTSSWTDFTQACDRIALSPVSTAFTFLLGGPVDELLYEGLQLDTDVSKMILSKPNRLLRRGI